ncbi:Derlin 1, partial [Irineochytrium annulatum]
MDELQRWFASIPPVTRFLFCGSLGISITAKLGFIDPYYLILSWPLVWQKYQIWRLVTSFFFSPVGWGYLMLLYFLYRYSWALEEGRPRSDYVFFIGFCMTGISALGLLLNQMMLLEPLTLALLYVWAMDNKDQTVSFFFGLQFKAMYLPYVLIIFDFLQGERFPPVGKLIGIGIGHLYHFLDIIYPTQNGGQRILSTPQFLKNMFDADAQQGGAPGAGLGGLFPRMGGARLGAAPAGAVPG